ncbi:MAG: STM3941 family protein [Cyclobacteriaceae bacterium]
MDIKLYKSPFRAIKLILLCSIFVIGGGFMLTKTDTPKWIWYLNIGFFGLGYPVGLFHLLDRRPQIIINEIGIFDRTTYKDFINWDVIQDAYPMDIHGQKFVCLIVDEKYEPSRKKGKLVKSLSKFSKDIGAQELNISLGQIQIDEIRLTEFILTMIKVRPEHRKDNINIYVLT